MFKLTTRIDFEKMKPLNNEGKNSTVYTFYDKQLGENFVVKKIEIAEPCIGMSYHERLIKSNAINLKNNSKNIDLGNGYSRILPIDRNRIFK